MLPQIPLARETLDINGAKVEVRALTRAEAVSIQALGKDVAKIECAVIAYATDTPLAEVESWYLTVPSDVVDPIVATVSRLSGLTEGASKSGDQADSA